MGWIILFLSAALACVAIALALAFAPRPVQVRHARRGASSDSRRTGRHTSERHRELSAMSRHMHLLRPFSPVPDPVDDPFEVLALQCRLTALADEIQRLERDRTAIARAHHLRASQYAYDALLAEACTLVGLPSEEWDPAIRDEAAGSWVVDEDTRMRKELELCARGWSW